jgi:hypothetical protein
MYPIMAWLTDSSRAHALREFKASVKKTRQKGRTDSLGTDSSLCWFATIAAGLQQKATCKLITSQLARSQAAIELGIISSASPPPTAAPGVAIIRCQGMNLAY